jgi:hypothetical protein
MISTSISVFFKCVSSRERQFINTVEGNLSQQTAQTLQDTICLELQSNGPTAVLDSLCKLTKCNWHKIRIWLSGNFFMQAYRTTFGLSFIHKKYSILFYSILFYFPLFLSGTHGAMDTPHTFRCPEKCAAYKTHAFVIMINDFSLYVNRQGTGSINPRYILTYLR